MLEVTGTSVLTVAIIDLVPIPSDTTYQYQWFCKLEPIAEATTAELNLRQSRCAAQDVSVNVTASAAGYSDYVMTYPQPVEPIAPLVPVSRNGLKFPEPTRQFASGLAAALLS
jgi:hypothetical protein